MNLLGTFDLYFPPEYLRAALILSLLSVWVLVGLYSYLNRYTCRRYFTIWTVAWLFYALWLTLGIRFHQGNPGPLVTMLQEWCIGASAVFLLWGSASFLGHTAPQRLYGLFFGFLMAWGYVGAYHLDGALQSHLPIFSLLGFSSVWTAWGYFRMRKVQGFKGASLLALGFLMWGGYLFSFPFLMLDPILASPAFFISGVLQTFIAVSMIVLVLEEVRFSAEKMRIELNETRGVNNTLSSRNEVLNSTVVAKEEALQLSELRFRSLAMSAPVGILQTDAMGRCVFVNERWRELTGISSSQLTDESWLRRVHESDRDAVRQAWAAVVSQDDELQCEFRMGSGGESVIWVLAQSTRLADASGVTTGFLLTIADITRLKHAEQDRQVLEAQLRHSQKMETVGTLAGGIAHGFNNLLQPILGFAGLALESLPEESDAREDLDYIMRAANRARELVKQMLTFSRQAEHERMPLQLHLLVNEAVRLVRASLPRSVEIEQNISKDCPAVLADATQIHQVVMNLCTNAYHAVRDKEGGCIRVTLDTVKLDEDFAALHKNLQAGDYVCLTVEDDGSGMDPETMRRIFEPFFTTKRGGQGTGLGLSVVHGIVTSHDGDVTVNSTKGKGTTFKVYFPPAGMMAITEEVSDQPIPRGSERILFIDDEEEIARLGKKMLDGLGYQTTVTTSSREAREAFAENPDQFDLVITDQMMPQITGSTLAREMLSQRADLPVIMITGFSEALTAEQSREIGIREFIKKPISTRDLGLTIRRVLDEKQSVDFLAQ